MKQESQQSTGIETVETVKEFTYLGNLITWDNDCAKDIRARITKAKGVTAGTTYGRVKVS